MSAELMLRWQEYEVRNSGLPEQAAAQCAKDFALAGMVCPPLRGSAREWPTALAAALASSRLLEQRAASRLLYHFDIHEQVVSTIRSRESARDQYLLLALLLLLKSAQKVRKRWEHSS